MKITVLLDYPDEANPQFSAFMEMHGGKVDSVHFADLFQAHDELVNALSELVDFPHDAEPTDAKNKAWEHAEEVLRTCQ